MCSKLLVPIHGVRYSTNLQEIALTPEPDGLTGSRDQEEYKYTEWHSRAAPVDSLPPKTDCRPAHRGVGSGASGDVSVFTCQDQQAIYAFPIHPFNGFVNSSSTKPVPTENIVTDPKSCGSGSDSIRPATRPATRFPSAAPMNQMPII